MARKISDDRHADPGYYLIAHGRVDFERELGFRVSWKRRLFRWYVRAAVPGYLGTIFLLTAMILFLPLLHSKRLGVTVCATHSPGGCSLQSPHPTWRLRSSIAP